MSSYILKDFSERSKNIVFERKTVGEVRLVDGKWNGQVRGRDGRLHGARGFTDAASAFHAVLLVMKIENLKARVPDLEIDSAMQGTGSRSQDTTLYNIKLDHYVSLFNKHSSNQLRTYAPRRRR